MPHFLASKLMVLVSKREKVDQDEEWQETTFLISCLCPSIVLQDVAVTFFQKGACAFVDLKLLQNIVLL